VVVGAPGRLREQIVDHINAARREERQREIQKRELPGPGVRVDEVKAYAPSPFAQKVGSIDEVKGHAGVVTEMVSSNRQNGGITFNGV
jgi:hypothetical protein